MVVNGKAQWKTFGCILCSLEIVVGLLCLIIQGPHDPHCHLHPLYPVVECLDVLSLLQDSNILQGEENLRKIKTQDILVIELSKLAAYLIFNRHAWC